MLCPACNNFRPVNSEPCPRCNAFSPLAGESGGDFGHQSPWADRGSTAAFAPGSARNNNMTAPVGPQGEMYDNSLWAQVMAPQAFSTDSPANAQPPSLLPVPYQPQQAGIMPQ